MAITQFNDLVAHAEREQYAVGYFECWNLESLMAVADAAETTQSPVLLGFSGIYLPHPQRLRPTPLSVFSSMGLEVCRQISVPSALVFNESPRKDWVIEAIDQGFGMVMFSDEHLSFAEQKTQAQQVVEIAHQAGVAVEGEAESLPGIAGNMEEFPTETRKTSVEIASEFVEQAGVDAFAVNIGQVHYHGWREVYLDLVLLKNLKSALDVPMVLHGATSVLTDDLTSAIQYGIRKINVGSALKQVYFDALRKACKSTSEVYNPYEVIGSGLNEDVLMAGRIALQQKVENYMHLFGSSGKAKSFS
jgi:fructose-bisphosphate aldolase class II